MGGFNSDLIRGNIDTIILKCLARGDMYGIEICNLVKEASLGTYILKQPTLYSALRRLENKGLITGYLKESTIGGTRHYYKLTETGENTLLNKADEWALSKEVIDTIIFGRQTKTEEKVDVVLAKQEVLETVGAPAAAVNDSGLGNAAVHIEEATAALSELDRAQNSRYEQLFANARKHFLSATKGSAIGDYITVPLMIQNNNPEPEPVKKEPVLEIYNPVPSKKEQQNDGLLKYLSPQEYEAINAERRRVDQLTAFAERTAQKAQQERIDMRPHIKHYGKKSGNYVMYNKLRLVCSFLVGLMLVGGVAGCSALLKPVYSASEQTFFIFGFAAAAFYVLFNVAFYTAYPKQKRALTSRKADLLKRTVLMLSVAAATLGTCLLIGLSGVNASDFVVYCAVTCVIGSVFFLEGLWIWALRKLRVFAA